MKRSYFLIPVGIHCCLETLMSFALAWLNANCTADRTGSSKFLPLTAFLSSTCMSLYYQELLVLQVLLLSIKSFPALSVPNFLHLVFK